MKYNTEVIVGAQWGDEGKGKVSDYLSQSADIVVRYQGGNNAGHSIEFEGNRYALKHIPSGIFNPKTKNIMAQGMVINPKMLLEEIKTLETQGIKNYQLLISDRAHVIMPYHLDLDAKFEEIKGKINFKKKLGTTKKGIGPAYEDKAARIGIRVGDFIDPQAFKTTLEDTLVIKNKILKALGLQTYNAKQIIDEYSVYAQKLKPMVIETGSLLASEAQQNKKIIFEGAQGVMLCLENGTYPYVTSSSPTASSVPLAAGLNPSYINNVLGIVKAYTTRVGAGALPTEIEKTEPSIANHIREKGREYGTVTKRPRRIGWLDTVVLKHSARVSGFNGLAITLIDVLDEVDTIKIGYAYELDGKEINYIPGSNQTYGKCQVKYIQMPGWKQDTSKVKSFESLPTEAQNYINKIQELVGVKVKMFSVGPDRNQTIKI